MIIHSSALAAANETLLQLSNITTFSLCFLILILALVFLVFVINSYIHTKIEDDRAFRIILCQDILKEIFQYNIDANIFGKASIGNITSYSLIGLLCTCTFVNISQLIISAILEHQQQTTLTQLQNNIQLLSQNTNTIGNLQNTNNTLQDNNNNISNIIQEKQSLVDGLLNGTNANNQQYKLQTAQELTTLIQYIKSIPTFQDNDVKTTISQNNTNNKTLSNIFAQSQICNTNITNFSQSIDLINQISSSTTDIFNDIPTSQQLGNRINTLNNYNFNSNLANEMLQKIQQINPNINDLQDLYNFLNYIQQLNLPGQLTNEPLFAYLDRIFNEIQQAQQNTLNTQIEIQSLQQQNQLLKQLSSTYLQMFNNNFQVVTSINEITQIINNIIPQILQLTSNNIIPTPSTSKQLFNYIGEIQQNDNIASIISSYSKMSNNIIQQTDYNSYFNNLTNLINLLETQNNNQQMQDNSQSKRLASILRSSVYGQLHNMQDTISNIVNPSLHNINAGISKTTNISNSKNIINNTTSTIAYAQNNDIPIVQDSLDYNTIMSTLIAINNQLAQIFTNLSTLTNNNSASDVINSDLLQVITNINNIDNTMSSNSNTIALLTDTYNQIHQMSSIMQNIDVNNSNFNMYTNSIFSAIDSTYYNTEPLLNNNDTYSNNISNVIINNQLVNSVFTQGNPWTINNIESTNNQLQQYISDMQSISNETINVTEMQSIYAIYNQLYTNLQPIGSAFHKLLNDYQSNSNVYNNIQLLLNDFINSYNSIANQLPAIDPNSINTVLQSRYGSTPINTINSADVNPFELTNSNFNLTSLMSNASINMLKNPNYINGTLVQYPVIAYNNNQMSNLLSTSTASDNILKQWSQLTTLDKLLSLHTFYLFPSGTVGKTDAYTIMNNNSAYSTDTNKALAEHSLNENSRIANNILYNFHQIITHIPQVSTYNTSNLGSSIYTQWSSNLLNDLNLEGNNGFNSMFQYAKWKFYLKNMLLSKISDWFVNGYYSHDINTTPETGNGLFDLSQIPNVINQYNSANADLGLSNIGVESIGNSGYKGHSNNVIMNNLMAQEYIDQLQNPDLFEDVSV